MKPFYSKPYFRLDLYLSNEVHITSENFFHSLSSLGKCRVKHEFLSGHVLEKTENNLKFLNSSERVSWQKVLPESCSTYSKPQNVIIIRLRASRLALPVNPLKKHRAKAQFNRSELNDNNLRKLCPILRR